MENRDNRQRHQESHETFDTLSAPDMQIQQDDEALNIAWDWLCKARQSAPASADIWDLRYRWESYRDVFLQQLQLGEYRLSPMLVVGHASRAMWGAADALALKWLALRLEGALPLHAQCEHVKGHGGGKTSIEALSLHCQTAEYHWVCRTDIRGYYGNINKSRLLTQLRQHVSRQAYLSLLTQYVHYSVEDGGEFSTPKKGIARGCALSPLMGALHLWAIDVHFASQKKTRYARYMDDFVILATHRWHLRRQVKSLNQFLQAWGFEKHPEKTFIGRISAGFDWLGAWITDKGVEGVSPRALANHREKVRRLYERTRYWPKRKQAERVLNYRKRWQRWVMGTMLSVLPVTGWCIDAPPGTWVSLGSFSSTTPFQCALAPFGCASPYKRIGYATFIRNDGNSLEQSGYTTRVVDGQYGWDFDGLLVSVEGSCTLPYTGAGELINTKVSWSRGQPPTATPSTNLKTVGLSISQTTPKDGVAVTGTAVPTATCTGKLWAYVPSNMTAKTVTIPALTSATWYYEPNYSVTWSPSQTISVKPRTCSIKGPDVVKFGPIEATGALVATGELIGSATTSVTVNCSSDGETPSFGVMSAPGGSGFDNYLRRTGGDVTEKVVSVRTFVGNVGGPTPSVVSCEEAPNLMSVAGVGSKTPIGSLSGGSNILRFRFSLCGQGQKIPPGEYKTSATFTVDWN